MNSVWIISYTRSLARYKYELSAYIPDTALWLLIKNYGHRIYVYNRHTTVIEYQVIYSDTSYVRKSDTECLILNLSVVFMDTLGLCSSPNLLWTITNLLIAIEILELARSVPKSMSITSYYAQRRLPRLVWPTPCAPQQLGDLPQDHINQNQGWQGHWCHWGQLFH